jgi:hypothetical protein
MFVVYTIGQDRLMGSSIPYYQCNSRNTIGRRFLFQEIVIGLYLSLYLGCQAKAHLESSSVEPGTALPCKVLHRTCKGKGDLAQKTLDL